MIEIVPAGADYSYSGKTLSERVTGRFYTPNSLANGLAVQMLQAFRPQIGSTSLKVIDPFSGDGQLVSALLVEASKNSRLLSRRWSISIWDRDRQALSRATERLNQLVSALGLHASLEVLEIDSFSAKLDADYDLVITNPPWELLKPDRREMALMTQDEAADYRHRLRAISDELDRRFPTAKASSAWGGWATNLARCGWDLSLQLLSRNGVLGIVLPSTLLGDQSSKQIRKFTFSQYEVLDVAAYPPEARLFERVDQPVVAMTIATAVKWRSGPGRVRVFGANRCVKHLIDIGPVAKLASVDYALPVGFGAGANEVIENLQRLPKLTDLEGMASSDLWLGRELDETRIHEKTVAGQRHPFVKGRMIARHTIAEHPSRSVRVDLAAKFGSASFPRAVWRDVSRSSQKRRMIGSVIPPGWIAGNSLHVAHFRDGNLQRTLALHGVLSSLVLEFQVRSRLATGHMSLGAVRQARVPEFTPKMVAVVANAVEEVQAGRAGALARLEVLVAKAYGLNRNIMEMIVSTFEKIEEQERDQLLDSDLWSERGNL